MNMMYNKNIKKAHAGHTRNRRECTMKSKKLAALGLTALDDEKAAGGLHNLAGFAGFQFKEPLRRRGPT